MIVMYNILQESTFELLSLGSFNYSNYIFEI